MSTTVRWALCPGGWRPADGVWTCTCGFLHLGGLGGTLSAEHVPFTCVHVPRLHFGHKCVRSSLTPSQGLLRLAFCSSVSWGVAARGPPGL